MASADLQAKLEKRLREAVSNKETLQTNLRKLQDSLQRLFQKTARRPKDTLADLDKKIANLERERTVTSVPLAREREILRQIKSIEKAKTQVQETQVYESEVQATKAKLDQTRDEIRAVTSSIDELEAGLAKVKLANKLGCKTQDIVKETMECPSNKVGMVIGRGGSTMKRIMEQTKVTMDVDKKTNIIEITGSPDAIADAKKEVEKITLSIEVDFLGSKDVVNYLTTKHVMVVQHFRDNHDELYMDVDRSSRKISVRGMPDDVNKVVAEIQNMEIERREINLTRREMLMLVGKKGATIDQFTKAHLVAIEVDKIDDEKSKASIIGPPDSVAAAYDEIDSMMHDNKEVIEKVPVSLMMKRLLVSDSAKQIRAIQEKISKELGEDDNNVYLTFDREQRNSDHPDLLVKARQRVVLAAVELAEANVNELKELIVSRPVIREMIPRIIGKGGENIKKLTENTNTYIEVDRDASCIYVGSITVEERDEVLAKLDAIIAENQILRVDADAAMVSEQFRELIRSKKIGPIRAIARLDLDDDASQFVFRGSEENNRKANEMLQEFLASTNIRVVEMTDEDFDALVNGGKNSKASKIEEEHDVKLNIVRSRSLVIIKGVKDHVDKSYDDIQKFLIGGDGHTVAKITVSEQVVGIVIGKGGKTRQGLEQKYEGVSVNISKAQRITIRGPEEAVAACRVEILKMIAAARVTQTIKVAEGQKQMLDKNNVIRRIMRTIPVQISHADETAEIRGTFHDVRDAMSLLKEQLSGVYTSSIELENPQFAKVRNTCRDPSHLSRIEDESKAKVQLDLSAGSLVLSGKRNSVRKAKDHVFGFLEFLLPQELARIPLPKPLHASVGKATVLADVSANAGGCTVYLDRDINSVIVASSDTEKVKIASELVAEKIKEGEKLVYMIQLDQSEAWIIPIVLGKDGAQIGALQKESRCSIDVSKEARSIVATGKNEEDVANARRALDTLVDKARKSNVFVTIPQGAVPKFLGKSGSSIKELQTKHGVDFQRGRRGNSQFRIVGKEENVAAAKAAVEAFISQWKDSNGSETLKVEKDEIPTIIGHKGSTIQSIQKDFGVAVDIDRTEMKVTVRGGTSEQRGSAIEKIKELAQAARQAAEDAAAEARAAKEARAAEKKQNGGDGQLPAKANGNRPVLPPDDIEAGDKNYARAAEFPTNPIGVASNGGKAKKGGQKEPTTQHGTEAGRSLFQMLIADTD